MSTPEPRFEVPPEYAEVYEQAYRRAYEEVQASLAGGGAPAPGFDDVDPPLDDVDPLDDEREDAPAKAVAGAEIGDAAVVRAPGNRSASGHRADRGRRHDRRPLLLAAGALLIVLAVVFVVGRLTAGSTSPSGQAIGQRSVGSSYAGQTRPATVRDASATCSALPTKDSGGATVDYDVRNVLDDDATTAWRCDRLAVGQELAFTLAPGTRVVQVGLVPGYALGTSGGADDTYARDNRITRVAWFLGNGTVVQQSMSDNPENRSLRTTIVPPTTTGEVRLKILRVTQGERNSTAISTVRILTVP